MNNGSTETLSSLMSAPLLYAFLAASLHVSLSPVVASLLPKNASQTQRLVFTEKILSTVHAAIVGGGAAWVIGSGTFAGDIVNPYTPLIKHLFAIYTGYSLYDCAIMALGAREPPPIWLHHIFGIAGAIGSMYYKKVLFVPTAFMISEISVIPVNWVWFLQTLFKVGIKFRPQTLRIALIARALTFLALRTPIGPAAAYYAVQQHNTNISGLWTNVMAGLPSVVRYGTATNLVVFSLLNLFWTIKSIKRVSR